MAFKRIASGVAACLLASGALVVATASVAHAQTITHTFPQVQCTAMVNGNPVTQAQDVTISITAPDSVSPGEQFTITFPGGSALLPSSSNGLTITNYSNLGQTLQIHGATFDPGSATVAPPGTATIVPTAAPHTPASIAQTASLPTADTVLFGTPGPFVPGTLTTPDTSVTVTAPATGPITLNMIQLTTAVLLNGSIHTSVTCNVPADTLITIPVGPGNTPPTVSAGPDVQGNLGDAIALSGTVTDPDSTPTNTWSVDSPFCSFDDVTSLTPNITCTKAGVFAATLSSDDGSNPPVTDSAQVTVLTPNVPPTVNAGPDVSGEVNDDIALNGTVTDPDSTPNTQWSVDSPNCSFDDPSSLTPVINCSVAGTYSATLTADDGVNTPVSDSAVVTVTPIPPGLTVKAGPDVSGNTGAPIALHGKITDPGNTPTSLWVSDGPSCSFGDATQVVTTITCTTAGIFTATLTGHDGVNPDANSTALVQVIQPNVAPIVSAGPDVTGAKSTAIALNGTVTDPDSTPVTQWTTDGPSCSFANASAAVTTITCTSAGVYTATLTADDGVNNPVSDVAIVTVVGNLPPTVNAGPDVAGSTNTPITLNGTVTDPDSTPTTMWSTANPNCSFADPTAIVTTITCTAGGFYAATLTASDGFNTPVSDTAIVTVVAPNVAPTVNAGPDRVAIVRHPVAIDASVTDPDNTPTVQWSTGNPSCSFTPANTIDTSFVCSTTGVFAATLTADDGVNPPVHDTVLVTFTPTACSNPCISVGDAMTYEGGVMGIPITLTTAQAVATSFTATIVPVTATNATGGDFKSAAVHKMKIAAGARIIELAITALNDNLVEPDETFNVVLSAASGPSGIAIGRSVGTGTIKDATGMPPGLLLIGSQSIVEIDTCAKCTATAEVPVVLSGPSASATVLYSTADAGATAGADYTKRTNVKLAFVAGGVTHKFVTVVTIGDNLPEPTEGINIKFTSPVNISLANGDTGTISILDND